MERAEGKLENFDLFCRFKKKSEFPNGSQQQQEEEAEEEEDEEIELSLGLSLNGRFGVDPTTSKKLKRSSSVANLVFAAVGAAENGAAHQPRGAEPGSHAPLGRTRSLPTETEEEWRRRKEMQSMRRMEARRKRMEKLKNSRVLRDKESDRKGKNGLDEGETSGGQRVDNLILRRSENGDVIDSSQGSIGPPKSGSSGSSDLIQGPKPKPSAEAPPSSRQSPPHEQEPAVPAPDRDTKGCTGVSQKNGMFDMPHVTTKENGPNGRKVEGFLYRYKKGEEVRIVCVCHGTFLTPKEFVVHGGGGEVEQPLKHIVVNPFPLF